jgi:hypothetical protein
MIFESLKSRELKVFGFFLVLIILGIFWQANTKENVSKNGVYTKCTVKEILGYKGGVRIKINYIVNGQTYSSLINYDGDGIKLNEQYFLKVLKDYPQALKFENKPVPKCLLATPAPPKGWQDIPICTE